MNAHLKNSVGWALPISSCILAHCSLAQGPIEIRFFNSTSLNASQIMILPSAGNNSSLTNNAGYTYWDKNSGTSLNGTSSNQTLRLSDLAYTPPAGGKPGYYSVYTTNFNSAAWLLGINTPHLPFGSPAPSPSNPSSNWGGYTYQPFELTIDGGISDRGDITYINQIGLPMQMRSYSSSHPSATANYTTGFLGNGAAVTTAFNSMMGTMQSRFPNAFVPSSHNPSGLALVSAPNSAPAGSLSSIAGGNQSFSPFTHYFEKIQAAQGNGSVTRIKDFINLTQGNATYSYYYNFVLDPISGNNTAGFAIGLTGNLTVVAGTGGDPTANGNYTGLSITIGSDDLSDPSLSKFWASSFVYLAPTPANTVGGAFPDFALGGDWATIASTTGYNGSYTSLSEGLDSFSRDVIGRIMGDLAAGFAFGFIGSDVTNPNFGNATYGDSPSGAWWGGNEYPAADNNSLMFGDVQPILSPGGETYYSEYAGILFDATAWAYGHPISDRMQFYADIQIPVYGFNTGNGTAFIEAIEIEFWDGVNAIPEVSSLGLLLGALSLVFLIRGRNAHRS